MEPWILDLRALPCPAPPGQPAARSPAPERTARCERPSLFRLLLRVAHPARLWQPLPLHSPAFWPTRRPNPTSLPNLPNPHLPSMQLKPLTRARRGSSNRPALPIPAQSCFFLLFPAFSRLPCFPVPGEKLSCRPLPVGPSEPRVIACLPASSFYHACLDFSGFQQTFQQISANFEKTTC